MVFIAPVVVSTIIIVQEVPVVDTTQGAATAATMGHPCVHFPTAAAAGPATTAIVPEAVLRAAAAVQLPFALLVAAVIEI